MCIRLYQQTSLPNLIGDESLDQIFEYFHVYKAYETASIFEGRCYQHLEDVACNTIFPKCDPVTKQVTHPFREMCWDVKEACLQKWQSLAENVFFRYVWDIFHGPSIIIDCDYLPSLYGSFPCFYKPVTCDSPQDVTDGTVMVNSTQKDIYGLHDVVQYTCINETLRMVGNNSVVCMYSGEWSSHPPRCVDQQDNSLHPLYVVLPVLTIFLIIYTTLLFDVWCKKRKSSELHKKQTV